jgi:hypothetical protein
MEAIELKFLLKLLGHTGYRAPISKLQPNGKTSASERDKVCRRLTDREIISYTREVKRFKIDPSGRSLLNQATEELPLTEQQLRVLKACKEKTITPGEVSKLSPAERQNIIQELEEKGFVQIEKAQIKEVWLTSRGHDFLRDEFNPSGSSTITLTLDQLQGYLNFLRKTVGTSLSTLEDKPVSYKLDDEEILQIIRDLDHKLGSENYLPIFYLREETQSSLSRGELDKVLYRLQRQQKIELSTLQEGSHYTAEQIEAGIPQPIGGPWFFIVLV